MTYLPHNTLGPEVLVVSVYIEYLIIWTLEPARAIVCRCTLLPAFELRVLALELDAILVGAVGSWETGVGDLVARRIVSEF